MATRKTRKTKKTTEEISEVQNEQILVPQEQPDQDEQTSIQQEIQAEPVEKQEKKKAEHPWYWRK